MLDDKEVGVIYNFHSAYQTIIKIIKNFIKILRPNKLFAFASSWGDITFE